MIINNYVNIGTPANDNFTPSPLDVENPMVKRVTARVNQIDILVRSYESSPENYDAALDSGTFIIYEIAKDTGNPNKIHALFDDTKRELSEQQIALLDEIVGTGIDEYYSTKLTTSK
jgi:hypothetical protein|tara:strand:- start:1466 stop:1816 length:351 start_codon:yes stop_codon:yes gene_type:complete